MKANWNLINALRRAAARLAHDDDYDHGCFGVCNCGFIAQELLGIKRSDTKFHLASAGPSTCWYIGSWAAAAKYVCPNTKLPIIEIVRELEIAGLPHIELEHVEKLSNPAIRKRAELSDDAWHESGYYEDEGDQQSVVRYFAAWADMLEEELNAAAEAFELRELHLTPKPEPAGV